MLIEIYKGVHVHHDASKDRFTTQLVLLERHNKKEYVTAPRLQQVRDEIDKFLNASTQKPVVKKAWLQDKYEKSFLPVEIVLYSVLTKEVLVKTESGKVSSHKLTNDYSNSGKLYLNCKENSAIIAELKKKQAAVDKIMKETSCMHGKLIPVAGDHFVK